MPAGSACRRSAVFAFCFLRGHDIAFRAVSQAIFCCFFGFFCCFALFVKTQHNKRIFRGLFCIIADNGLFPLGRAACRGLLPARWGRALLLGLLPACRGRALLLGLLPASRGRALLLGLLPARRGRALLLGLLPGDTEGGIPSCRSSAGDRAPCLRVKRRGFWRLGV